ncbi:helix-turn-helix transcriptional regulator [Devosia sp. MC521]|uniref:helix-turn-helix transcriptional regulator n=1 Tax=Devosia sp. MC521 TaxID=2759954 RepID=UPI0015F7C048|nr:helix-turn-helix transcriptional regulator [Devosia sp. MC521]MBJ6987080.1 helix-turn-helix transcriptional regulator [Devosia sp. MC521]QMW62702.1 helix-turn-helix transcriptional regulator [Devosia sp. MC521]
MNRIRKMRTDRGLSQKQLADMLGTTQQTVGRWETEKVQPSVASLREMAEIFGCHVSDLLDEPTPAVEHGVDLLDVDDVFWGHVGIKLHKQERTKWYPITEKESRHVNFVMNSGKSSCVVTTRNNRVLLLQLPNIQRICLISNKASKPEMDWEVDGRDCSGVPLDVYRGLYSWVAKELDRQVELGGISQDTARCVEDFAVLYEGEVGGVMNLLHQTEVHHTNGDVDSYWAHSTDLAFLRDDFWEDLLPPVVWLSSIEREYDHYYPKQTICMVEAPLLHLLKHEYVEV